MPEKTTPGSITQTADVQRDRINNISNVSRAINEMQKDVDQKISETNKRVERKEEVQAVQGLMTQTIGKLNQTIGALSTGVTRITADTAKATAGAIGQYGKAISEDISFNKKSVVAMALAKTSPLYGYFVSKFMETNVWKQALTKMKTSIMQTMGAILRPFKGGAAKGGQVPGAQTGGYIGQGGLAKVHAGEMITPASGVTGGFGGDMSRVVELLEQQLSYAQKTFGYEEKYYRSWFSRMSPMRVIRAFRRSKGNYAAQLSSSSQPLTNIAHNIATLYTQLMWRLDNMMEIQKANATANRDLTTYFTGVKYPAIKGIRLRSLVKPLIRKIVGGIIKAAPKVALATLLATGAPWSVVAAIAGPVAVGSIVKRAEKKRKKEAKAKGEEFEPGFLSKRRGLYKEEGPGILASIGSSIKGKYRGLFPTAEMVEQRGMGRGGTAGGLEGIEGRKRDPNTSVLTISPKLLATHIAIAIQNEQGGRSGRRRPLWVAPLSSNQTKKYYKFSMLQDKKQTKALTLIKTTNKKHLSIQEKWIRLQKKWRLMNWISKILGWVGSFVGTITGILTDIFTSVFSSPLVLAAITAALGGVAIGTFINKHITKPIQGFLDKQTQAVKDLYEKSHAEWERQNFKNIRDKTKGIEGYEARQKSSVTSGLYKTEKKRRSDVTSWYSATLGQVEFNAITGAQKQYQMENINRYLAYDGNEILRMRNEWLDKGGYWRGVIPGEGLLPGTGGIIPYGRGREASFLTYLEGHGTKLTEKQRDISILKYDKQVEDLQQKGALPTPKPPEKLSMGQKAINARAAAKNVLTSIYGFSEIAAEQKLKHIISQIDPNSPVLYNERALENVVRKAMKYDTSITGRMFRSPAKYDRIIKESAAKERASLEGKIPVEDSRVQDGRSATINASTLAKQDMESIEKQAELTSTPVVDEIKVLEDKVEKSNDKASTEIQQTQINSVNNMSTSISDSSAVTTGGGGGGGVYGLDPWQQYAILGGMH